MSTKEELSKLKLVNLQNKVDEAIRMLEKEVIPGCPFTLNDKCYQLGREGDIVYYSGSLGSILTSASEADMQEFVDLSYEQGNLFYTKEEAERERDRRKLLTQFRAFRDKCNGDWKPNWTNKYEEKLFIMAQPDNLVVHSTWCINQFPTFGFFKHKSDAELAITLFGDEIERLYVEVE